jgi:murein DD-endopeptidase MepM/ murein hydrolase activator NlpD
MPIRIHPLARVALAIAIAFAVTGRIIMLVLAQDDPSAAGTPAAVVDVTPPSISQPGNLYAGAADASGAVVWYDLPGAVDDVDGPVGVACDVPAGSLFPLGTTVVTCYASDAAGNGASVSFAVTVGDGAGPVIDQPADVAVTTSDPSGAAVAFAVPGAYDAIDGPVGVWCDAASGTWFAVGSTVVTCGAQDTAGNAAAAVAFTVTVVLDAVQPVDPTAVPDVPTDVPAVPTDVPTDVPTEAATEVATDNPTDIATDVPTDTTPTPGDDTTTPDATAVPTDAPTDAPTDQPTQSDPATTVPPVDTTPAPVDTPAPTATVPGVISDVSDDGDAPVSAPAVDGIPQTTPIVIPPAPTEAPTPAPTQVALDLPWPPPDSFVIVTDGGPIDGLAAIWNNVEDFPITQEFGHTDFSVTHPSWYAYGLTYGLDGYEHPGLDIGMPAGTPLYSPVEGTVKIAGGVPFYTFYGNGAPGVGELLIETASGDQVILGHMGRITVNVGDHVVAGQFVGLSGGDNGDHLHLEVREIQSDKSYKIVDPRKSFLIKAIADANTKPAEQALPVTGDPHRRFEVDAPSATDHSGDDPATTNPTTTDPSSTGAATTDQTS